MSDTTDALIQPGGECSNCKGNADRRLIVAIVEAMSGPSRSVYACLPCARRMARYRTAPLWLVEDVARLAAAEAAR